MTIPLAIKYVGAEQYGVWLTLTSATLLLYYSDIGIGTAVVHFGARNRATGEGFNFTQLLSSAIGVVSIVWVGLILVTASFVTAAYFGGYFGNFDSFQFVLIVVSLFLLVTGFLTKPFEAILIGAGHFVTDRWLKFCGSVVRLSGTLTVCLLHPTLGLLALVEAVSLVLPGVLAIFFVVKGSIATIRRQEIKRETVTTLWSYSYKRFAVDAVGAGVLQIGTLLVAVVASAAAVSYFSAAFRLYSGIRQVIAWVVDPFRTILSKLWVENRGYFPRVVLSFSLLVACVSWSVCCVAIILSPGLTPVWLGRDSVYYDAAGMVTILCLGLMINVLHIPLIASTDAAHRPGVFFLPQALWLVLYGGLALVLGGRFGAVGVCVAMALSVAILEPIYLYVAQRNLGFTIAEWVRTVFLPTFVLILPALMMAVSIAWSADFSIVWSVISALIFILLVLGSAYLLRSRLALTDIRAMLGYAL
ncbi:hypothetical protein [Gordonia amicalis]|uniref:hypothetical protein n=1 Tax=Gordonia amicalis TaxID=89053 RepID=UPI0024B8C901|nr:hypothetical protein [Gordonia amicalis]MDJ0455358.1 hypothetical protein [Gordonia amicalis]MDV7078806.1 hypothetical protein [Gordonia amicalis]